VIYLEHEAKSVLAAAGLPVPVGRLCTGRAVPRVGETGPWYVKAQVPYGGRGKGGLVRRADDEAGLLAAGEAIRQVAPEADQLVELAVPTRSERYVAIGLDTAAGRPYAVFGARGGIEIESGDPALLARTDISMARGVRAEDGVELAHRVGLPADEAAAAGALLVRLWDLFRRHQGELLEINPLIWDGARFVLADAKLRTFEHEAEDGTVYFPRPGPVAVLSGGAGLGMAVADMLHHLGTPPANFADIVGGVTTQRLTHVARQVLHRCRDDDVAAVLIVLSVSLTPLGGVLSVIRDVIVEVGLDVPAVAYFGSGAARSDTGDLLGELAGLGVDVRPELEQAISRAAELAGAATRPDTEAAS
jgi:succinyl-CoA synthetase beta subunit